MLMPIFNWTVQFVPCQSNNMWQARQNRHLNHNQSRKVLGLLCAELCWSACSSTAARRNLTDWDITALILELDSDARSLADDNISAHSNSDDDSDTNFTKWTDNTNCHPTVPVVHRFTGGPSWLWQRHPTSIKTLPKLVFGCSFLKLYNSWWKRQTDIITSTWTQWTKDGPHCLTWLFTKCLWFGNHCADRAWSEGHTERLLVDARPVLHGLLQKHYKMRQILSHIWISTF
jgi:hypothetical protein